MLPAEAYVAVANYFQTSWSDHTRIAGENIGDEADLKFGVGESWVRFTMDDNIGGQESLGDPMQGNVVDFRYQGVIIIQCFVPIGAGKVAAKQLADRALSIFERPSGSDVWFRNFHQETVGITENWYQVNVVGEFVNDHIVGG